MQKIVLACFWNNETNCGDKLYVDVFLHLTESYSKELNTEICDFYARAIPKAASYSATENRTEKISVKTSIIEFASSILPGQVKSYLKNTRKYYRINKYYRRKLKGADALVIPGGGLVEYAVWRDYYLLLEMLERICNKRRIPVVINSVGHVENESPKKWGERWNRIINSPCVIHFTCRDNLPFFRQMYPKTRQIPCLACLASDVYGIERDVSSNVVGVGLIRPDAFSDYGNAVSREFVHNYYLGLIDKLISAGFKVELFSVGVLRDYWFGEELMKHMPQANVKLCERAATPRMLIEQIARFKGILTVRTHSAYSAFSLNVPAVMFYFGKGGWEGKSREFMTMMGSPQNAVSCDELTPDGLVDCFEEAVKRGWDQNCREQRKRECRENFEEIMKKILV